MPCPFLGGLCDAKFGLFCCIVHIVPSIYASWVLSCTQTTLGLRIYKGLGCWKFIIILVLAQHCLKDLMDCNDGIFLNSTSSAIWHLRCSIAGYEVAIRFF